jgi:hypothetical protein
MHASQHDTPVISTSTSPWLVAAADGFVVRAREHVLVGGPEAAVSERMLKCEHCGVLEAALDGTKNDD